MGFVVQLVISAYWQGVEKTRLAILEKRRFLLHLSSYWSDNV